MSEELLKSVLKDAYKKVYSLFGSRLKSAILFGSYARGDYDVESDVDIALLVDCTRQEVGQYFDGLASIATDIGIEHGQLVSFVCIPYADYSKWLPTLPFYQNIHREGVKLSV